MSLREDVQRGYRAEQLRDEFLAPAFAVMRESIGSRLLTCPPSDVEMMRAMVIELQVIARVERDLQAHIDSGDMARNQLEKNKQSTNMR